MSETLQMWLAVALIMLGLIVTTLAVFGMFRLNEFRLRLHAASMVSVMGVLPMLLASFVTGETTLIARAWLMMGFLLLTTSASLHALACADLTQQLKKTNDENYEPDK